jgi:hypothetical protein
MGKLPDIVIEVGAVSEMAPIREGDRFRDHGGFVWEIVGDYIVFRIGDCPASYRSFPAREVVRWVRGTVNGRGRVLYDPRHFALRERARGKT